MKRCWHVVWMNHNKGTHGKADCHTGDMIVEDRTAEVELASPVFYTGNHGPFLKNTDCRHFECGWETRRPIKRIHNGY
jgi:hypothetical protein